MKRTEKIVGIGHRTGISKKTNNPYDFYIAFTTYHENGVEGIATGQHFINDYDVVSLIIGNEYDIISHYVNGREYVDAIIPVGYNYPND